MTTDNTPRSIEHTVRIEAPPDVVWHALTDASALANWFPAEARVEPGAGGSIWMRFSPDVEHTTPIGAWDENAHLELVYCEPNEQVPHRVAVDYFLESDSGATVLRLVHSGFSRDGAWDAMYDATRRGWACMLPALKHWLERHRGVARDPILIKQSVGPLSVDQAWARLFGPHALAGDGSIDGLAPGDTFALTTVDGDEFSGRVRRVEPPIDLEATLESHNDGLIRVQVDDLFGRRDAYVTLWLWGLPARDVAALRGRLEALVSTVLPGD